MPCRGAGIALFIGSKCWMTKFRTKCGASTPSDVHAEAGCVSARRVGCWRGFGADFGLEIRRFQADTIPHVAELLQYDFRSVLGVGDAVGHTAAAAGLALGRLFQSLGIEVDGVVHGVNLRHQTVSRLDEPRYFVHVVVQRQSAVNTARLTGLLRPFTHSVASEGSSTASQISPKGLLVDFDLVYVLLGVHSGFELLSVKGRFLILLASAFRAIIIQPGKLQTLYIRICPPYRR